MILSKIYTFLLYLSMISMVVPLVIGSIKFKTLNRTLGVLFVFIIVSVLTELLSYIYLKLDSSVVFVLQNVFSFLECLLLMLIYYFEFNGKNLRAIIFSTFLIYLVITIKVLFWPYTFEKSNNIMSPINSVILMSLSVYFFVKVQMELTIPSLREYAFYWFNCGVLIYFSTSLILFLCGDYLDRCSKREFQLLWSLHLFTNILVNFLYSISLWKAKLK